MKNCPQCDTKLTKKNSTYSFDTNHGISVTVKADYCKECNEYYYNPQQSNVILYASKQAKL